MVLLLGLLLRLTHSHKSTFAFPLPFRRHFSLSLPSSLLSGEGQASRVRLTGVLCGVNFLFFVFSGNSLGAFVFFTALYPSSVRCANGRQVKPCNLGGGYRVFLMFVYFPREELWGLRGHFLIWCDVCGYSYSRGFSAPCSPRPHRPIPYPQ